MNTHNHLCRVEILGALAAIGLVVSAAVVGCSRDDNGRGATQSSVDRMAYVTHYHQGLELARRFQAARALVEFESCLAIRPDQREALFHKARMLLHLERTAEGVALLDRLATSEPAMLAACQLLIEFYDAPGPLNDPNKARALKTSVAKACGQLGAFDRVVRRWQGLGCPPPSPSVVLIHKPKMLGIQTMDSRLSRLRDIYSRRFNSGVPIRGEDRDLNRNIEYFRAYRQLIDEHPGMAGICAEHGGWLFQSNVRLHLPRDSDQVERDSSITMDLAEQYLDRALDACALDSPQAHQNLLSLGFVAEAMGDFDQAIQIFSLLLEQPRLSPDVAYNAHGEMGVSYYKRGEFDKAKHHFEWCNSRNPRLHVKWLLGLVGSPQLQLRPEPVDDEHRRTLKFIDRAADLGVDKYDGAGPSAWGDVDGDGDLDLFVAGCDTYSILYRNDGGRFTDASRQAGLENVLSGFSATFADYDNDGDCDLYIGRDGWGGPARNSLYRNRGDGTFEDVTDRAGVGHLGSTFVHGWADFDRDGFLDLFIANGITDDGSTNVLYHNNGDGTFTDVTVRCRLAEKPGTQTIGFAIGDYDRDGWPDIFVNARGTRHRLYHNRGDGTFEEVAVPAGADGRDHPNSGFVAFFADFDNDTWPDILLTKLAPFPAVLQGMLADYKPSRNTTDHATKLYRNQRDGTFVDESEKAGLLYAHGTMGANVGDVNNDGYLDFYLGTGAPPIYRLEPNAFYLNTGDGRFVDLTRFTGLGHLGKGHGITYVDYDFDGDLDIYTPQGGFSHGDLWRNAFYVNKRGNVNHWLSIQLEGSKSNRMGVGAQLTLRSGDFVIYREMTAGGAFGSSSSPFVHFGLGNRTQIDSLEVAWPSGERQVYTKVPVNRFIRIVESAKTVVELQLPQPPQNSSK